MKIFLLKQSVAKSYDTYDSAVVIAENEEAAKKISPDEFSPYNEQLGAFAFLYGNGESEISKYTSWATYTKDVEATYLGEAKPGSMSGVVCASFNAG